MAFLLPPSQQHVIIPDGAAFDFMTDVAASENGQVVVTNAPFQDTDANGENSINNAGAIWISDTNVIKQKITPRLSQRQASAVFGHHVDVSDDGKVIVTSARGENSNTGAIYIIAQDNGGLWSVKLRHAPSWLVTGDKFGFGIAVSDEYLPGKYHVVASSPFATDSFTADGRIDVYTYDINENTLTFQRQLTSTLAANNENLGYVLDISGDGKTIIAASRQSDLSGRVHVWRNGDNLFANPNFDADTDWSKDSDWSIANGIATQGGFFSHSDELIQTGIFNIGQLHEMQIERLAQPSPANLTYYLGGTEINVPNIPGVHTTQITAGTTNTKAGFFAYIGFSGSIDNASLVALDWGSIVPVKTNDQVLASSLGATANDYYGISNSSSPTTFAYHPIAVNYDGTYIVVGGYNVTNGQSGDGIVDVWKIASGTYSVQTTYDTPNTSTFFSSGVAIDKDGTFLVIGEQEFDNAGDQDQGGFYYASRSGSSWTSLSSIVQADSPGQKEFMGYDLHLSSSHIFSVASDYNTPHTDLGACYVFKYSSGAVISATDVEAQLPVDYQIEEETPHPWPMGPMRKLTNEE